MKVITTRSCALDMSDHSMDQFWRETFCEKLSVGNFLRKILWGEFCGKYFGGESLVGNVPCTSGCCIVLRGEEKINEKEKKKESAQKG